MLQAIRDKTRGWIAYVIVAILVVPFALFGLYNYVGGGGPQVVATVDGEDISRHQFDQAWQQRQADLRRVLGDQFDLSQLNTAVLRRDTLDELVDRQLLINFARDHGLQVSDGDVVRAIRAQPLFQVDGVFSSERYRAILAQNRLSAEQYESQLRRDLALDLVARALGIGTFVNQRELERVVGLQWQERQVGWIDLPQAAFVSDEPLAESQIEAFFTQTADQYRAPEAVRLSYIELDPSELAAQISVSDADVQARYRQLQDAAQAQSAREIRHILTETEDEIRAAQEQLNEGATFAEVAQERSIDRGSAANGGALGLLQPGDLEEAFESVAWELEIGERSGPVQTSSGWHLIEVTNVRLSDLPELSDIAAEIEEELARAEADRLLFEQGNTLDTLAFDHPDSLEPAADALGVDIQATDWISRQYDGEGIGAEPAVRNAAFSAAVLSRGENSPLLELSEGRYAVVRVEAHREARQQTLEEVQPQVEARLREQMARERAEEAANQLARRIVSGQPLADVVTDDEFSERITVVEPVWAQRDGGVLPSAINEFAFRLPRVEGESTVETLATNTGWAVVQLSGVRDGDVSEIDLQATDQLADSLRQIDSEIAFEAVLAELRAQARIRLNEGLTD